MDPSPQHIDWDIDSRDHTPDRAGSLPLPVTASSRSSGDKSSNSSPPFSPDRSSGSPAGVGQGSGRHDRRRSARALFGLEEDRPMKRHYTGAEHLLWSRIRATLQEPFSEFLGVMVLTCFYSGSIAQALLSAGQQTAPGGYGYGTYMSVPWGTGIGVMLGIYIAGDSGAYLNPAITLANCIFRGLPWRSLPAIVSAQFLGAFVATALIYGNYISAIDWYSGPGNRIVPPADKATAQIFASYPQSYAPVESQVFSVIIPTGLITVVVSALKDDYNNGISKAGGNFFPLAMFFLFYGIGVAFGWETGGAVNPALDFSGRLMSSAVGYPREVWTASSYYFWVPFLMPFVGAVAGGFLYDTLVFTGPSPINSPWLGLKRMVDQSIEKQNSLDRTAQRRSSKTVEV